VEIVKHCAPVPGASAPGDYAFEPAGETHTLVVPDDVQEDGDAVHVTGGCIYIDPYGVAG